MTAALAPAPSTPRTADDGSVRFLAPITGVPDEVGDVLVPGCFRGALARITPKIVDGHDWKRLVGRVTEAIELLPGDRRLPARTPDGDPWPRAAGALLVHGRFNLGTEAGRTAHANARFYAEDAAYSIGYKVRPGGARQRGGLRHITDLDLFEVSQVLHGAHPWARGLPVEVKRRPPGLEVKAMPTRRRSVPLGDLDLLRHERIGRDVARWDREDGDDDREPFEQLVERDPHYEMAADGTLHRVLSCASCGTPMRFPRASPDPTRRRGALLNLPGRGVTGEGGTVNDRTVGEVADGVGTLLAAIKAGELTCSAVYRNRLEGAVVALKALASQSAAPGKRPRDQ